MASAKIHPLFPPAATPPPPAPQPPKLLNQVRNKIRLKHYSIRTEQAYVDWIRRFILFHTGLSLHPFALSLSKGIYR